MLVLVGVGVLYLTLPISGVIVLLLAIVVISYQQTIRAYPSGGGSYIVASDNLGMLAGLTAAGALLVDYVLTVSVSIASGVAQITSLIPDWLPYEVPLGGWRGGAHYAGQPARPARVGQHLCRPHICLRGAHYALIGYGLYRMFFAGGLTYVPAGLSSAAHR